jgi:hypothetical protein
MGKKKNDRQKRHEHLLPTFLLRYEVYTYENLHRDELSHHTLIFFGNLENSGLITTCINQMEKKKKDLFNESGRIDV